MSTVIRILASVALLALAACTPAPELPEGFDPGFAYFRAAP